MTEKTHDTQLGWQVACRGVGDLHNLATNKGYDWMQLYEKLREGGVRPLTKHRIFQPVDHVHSAQIDEPQYRRRSMCETVFSSIKRMHGDAVRARTWHREFHKLVLKCVVHNIKRAAT